MNAKKTAAEKAAAEIKDGMVVGLGTGSTAYWAIQTIGEKVKQGLKIPAVATSEQSEKLARELGIPIVSFTNIQSIDVTIDGADEADKNGNLIKGGGGALLREKIIAANSKQFIVVVDETKLVDQLGRFLLPVEIVPFAFELTLQKIKELGGQPQIRKKEGKDFITDNGNVIADCHFYPITDVEGLNSQLHMIPGVVETGLFLHTMVSAIVVGYESGQTDVIVPDK
jgi:ribose 5-phosphate isomerase A